MNKRAMMEVCVKKKKKLWLMLQVMLGVALVGVLVSACSLPGSTTTNPASTPGTQTNNQVSPGVTATPHPVANQPNGISNLPPGNPLPPNEVKPLVFNLEYNDAAMEHDIAQMYTQGSPSFHQFLTPDQIVQRYAVSDSQLKQVTDWLTQNGYTISEVDPLRSGIKVEANVATIERTLQIKLESYNIGGHEFFMQRGDAKLPNPVALLVQSIVGLDNFAIPEFKPPVGLVVHAHTAPLAGNCSQYGAKQTLTRDRLAAAYHINQLYQQGFQGQGMTVAVAEFDEPYNPQDIANYAACVGIATPKIQNIDVDGHVAAGSGEGEAALDLELIAGLAPQAQILDYQANTNNTSFAQALVDVFNRVAADNKVQVLSVSYGTAEDSLSTSEQAAVNRSLRNLAMEGISVFISSGDCGAYSRRFPKIAQVSFPASALYAISVGGTYLQVNDNNVTTSEIAWGADDGVPVCQNEWGSGGGVSQNTDFRRPSWQIGQGTTTHYDGKSAHVVISPFTQEPVSAPNGLRQVPDIAAAAYANIAIYYNGTWIPSGGTSAAAPIWAAGTILVDQGLKQKGKGLFGSVPEIYTLANHSGSFHPYSDITKGDNLFYTATPGWDYVTGWGSPNFNDILQIEQSR